MRGESLASPSARLAPQPPSFRRKPGVLNCMCYLFETRFACCQSVPESLGPLVLVRNDDSQVGACFFLLENNLPDGNLTKVGPSRLQQISSLTF